MPKEPETISARASRIVSDWLKKIMKAGCLRQARYDYLISDDIQESILAVSRYQSTKLFWPLSGLTALCFRLKACGHVSASTVERSVPVHSIGEGRLRAIAFKRPQALWPSRDIVLRARESARPKARCVSC